MQDIQNHIHQFYRMDTRSQQILTWASAFLLGISIQRWLRQWRETATERLHSAVGRAAQWMAAMRAIESLEPDDALFVDDLAGTLAGKRMVRRALHLARRVCLYLFEFFEFTIGIHLMCNFLCIYIYRVNQQQRLRTRVALLEHKNKNHKVNGCMSVVKWR